MSDILGIAQKVRHFLILVPKTAMISWQKFVGHMDGTSGAELGRNTDWTLIYRTLVYKAV